MLGQMFSQEEERGDIPPPVLQWMRTRTRIVGTRDRTDLDFRNGAKVVRASNYEDVKSQLLEKADGVEKGVGLRRVPGCAKLSVPTTLEEKVRELRREIERIRRRGRDEEKEVKAEREDERGRRSNGSVMKVPKSKPEEQGRDDSAVGVALSAVEVGEKA